MDRFCKKKIEYEDYLYEHRKKRKNNDDLKDADMNKELDDTKKNK